jgi:hypothetical protein
MYTYDVGLAVSLNDEISIENFLSLQIANGSSSNKCQLFPGLRKRHFREFDLT